jgi:hypothetical protein
MLFGGVEWMSVHSAAAQGIEYGFAAFKGNLALR